MVVAVGVVVIAPTVGEGVTVGVGVSVTVGVGVLDEVAVGVLVEVGDGVGVAVGVGVSVGVGVGAVVAWIVTRPFVMPGFVGSPGGSVKSLTVISTFDDWPAAPMAVN